MFHSDPSHGWLEVRSHLIPDEIRNETSPYSYEKDGMAMLEEDCDAPRYLNWLKEQGIEYKISEIDTNKDHYCRNWPQFKGRKQ